MASGIPYTPKPVTDIFTNDSDIDRRACKRVVPMKVLALGLGRTGTACELTLAHTRRINPSPWTDWAPCIALRTALRELGYVDTYHMMNASVENPPDCLMWQDAFAAIYDGKGKFGKEEWDALLGHCQVWDMPRPQMRPDLPLTDDVSRLSATGRRLLSPKS